MASTMTAEKPEQYEWASGSMKDLAQKMDDIDKQLEEIVDDGDGTATSTSSPARKTGDEQSDDPVTPARSFVNDTSTLEDSDDDEGSERDHNLALDDLQSELNEINVAAAQVTTPQKAPAPPAPVENVDALETKVSATVTKPTAESTIGISMKTIKGITRITAIKPEGLLQDTSLKPGFQIVRVNGVAIRNAKHARFLIQDAKDKVTIETLSACEQAPSKSG